VSPETKAWWTKRVDDFVDQKCRVITPVTTVDCLWFPSIAAMQQNPANYQRREGLNASLFDGWVAQRIDFEDEKEEIVMVQEPFYMKYPWVPSRCNVWWKEAPGRQSVGNQPCVEPRRHMDAPRVRLRPLWDACPFLTIQIVTGQDSFWLRAEVASIRTNLPIRLYGYGLGCDDFDHSLRAAVRGVSRKGCYSWQLSINVRYALACGV